MMWVLSIAALLAAAQDGPSVDVSVTLDPPVIPFHRQALFTITVEVTGDADVKLPEMVGKFGGIDVAEVRNGSKAIKGGRKEITQTYVLDPLVAGHYGIAPVEVTWGKDNQRIVVPSPGLRVRDLTAEEVAAAEQFVGNAGTIPLPKPWWQRWEYWATCAGAAALLAGLVVYWRRHRVRVERMAPPRPAWEVAYERLRELDGRQWPREGRFEPYYVHLSSILRYYIEDRFLLHAPEQTTPEFLDAASRAGALSEEQQRRVGDFLRHCDRVKFARYEPTLNEMEHAFEVVLRFVDDTVPRETVEPKGAAA